MSIGHNPHLADAGFPQANADALAESALETAEEATAAALSVALAAAAAAEASTDDAASVADASADNAISVAEAAAADATSVAEAAADEAASVALARAELAAAESVATAEPAAAVPVAIAEDAPPAPTVTVTVTVQSAPDAAPDTSVPFAVPEATLDAAAVAEAAVELRSVELEACAPAPLSVLLPLPSLWSLPWWRSARNGPVEVEVELSAPPLRGSEDMEPEDMEPELFEGFGESEEPDTEVAEGRAADASVADTALEASNAAALATAVAFALDEPASVAEGNTSLAEPVGRATVAVADTPSAVEGASPLVELSPEPEDTPVGRDATESVRDAAMPVGSAVELSTEVAVGSAVSVPRTELTTPLAVALPDDEPDDEVEFEPSPVSPPLTPAASRRSSASSRTSHAMLVPALLTSGSATQVVFPAQAVVCQAPLTHWAKAEETQACCPSLQEDDDAKEANCALSFWASRAFCFWKSVGAACMGARSAREAREMRARRDMLLRGYGARVQSSWCKERMVNECGSEAREGVL